MAYEIPLFDITAYSSGDMSSNQYKFVTLSTTNAAEGCILGPSSHGGRAHGVWQGNSTASEYGKVRALGVSKVLVSTGSGPLAFGSPITGSTASGLGFAALATSTGGTQHIMGWSLAALASGSSGIVPILLLPTANIAV